MYRTRNFLLLAENLNTNPKAGVKCYLHRPQMGYSLPERSSSATIWILINGRCTKLQHPDNLHRQYFFRQLRTIRSYGQAQPPDFFAICSPGFPLSAPYFSKNSCTIPLILDLKIVRTRSQKLEEVPNQQISGSLLNVCMTISVALED